MPDGLAADPRRAPRKQDKALQREWAWDRGLECKDLRRHWGVRCRVCLRCQALRALPQERAQLPIVPQDEQGLLFDARASSSGAGSRAPPPTAPAASANSRCHSPESKSSHQFPGRDACFPKAPATKHAWREAQAILAQGQFQFQPLGRPITRLVFGMQSLPRCQHSAAHPKILYASATGPCQQRNEPHCPERSAGIGCVCLPPSQTRGFGGPPLQ